MKVRLTRVMLAVTILAAMALSTGAGMRWGFSARVVEQPTFEQTVDLSAEID